MPKPNSHPRELRDRAVRMVDEIGEPGAIRRVADKLGVSQNTVRYWVKVTPVDQGGRRRVSAAELDELRALRKEVSELRRANEILKSASAFFAKELDRPRTR
ncbi:MAG: transposase [Vicinamibacterales bacterium]